MSAKRNRKQHHVYDVIVVGAGAAGIGLGVALQDAGIDDYLILDRRGIGASFASWPKEMTFITPSFPTNSVRMLDLNSIAIGTSPAYTLSSDYPSGKRYAQYLQAVAEHYDLTVDVGADVEELCRSPESDEYELRTSRGSLFAKFVIWAVGEFQSPRTNPFPGSQFCVHNSQVSSWRSLRGEEFVVIGGYESGLDAAMNLAALGKRVTVLSRQATWDFEDSDPSISLSTHTLEKLRTLFKMKAPLELVDGADIIRVDKRQGEYCLAGSDGREWFSETKPILATGFRPSTERVAEFFAARDDGYPTLTEADESTLSPGLFLAGPSVRHEGHVFCFIFKFRQRFAVVVNEIARRLGIDTEEFERTYRLWGMFLDDLECCGEQCAC